MNKRVIVMLSTIALLVGASITEFQAQVSDVEMVVTENLEVVSIPDEALYRPISRELGRGWDNENPITIEDMSRLEEQQQQFKETLEQLNPDIVVVPTIVAPWGNELFNEVALKINENTTYIVYQLTN